MKLFIYLTLASIIAVSQAHGSSSTALETSSFQRVKQELWVFGPGLENTLNDHSQKVSHQQRQKADEASHIPEELTHVLHKYLKKL